MLNNGYFAGHYLYPLNASKNLKHGFEIFPASKLGDSAIALLSRNDPRDKLRDIEFFALSHHYVLGESDYFFSCWRILCFKSQRKKRVVRAFGEPSFLREGVKRNRLKRFKLTKAVRKGDYSRSLERRPVSPRFTSVKSVIIKARNNWFEFKTWHQESSWATKIR